MAELVVFPDPPAVHAEAVQRITAACKRAQEERDVFAWALAGGGTPRATYQRMRGACIDWQRVCVFWSDERPVSASSPDSNQHMAREAFLDAVPIPPEHVHPMNAASNDLEGAARAYESLMLQVLGDPPRVDVALLGLGEDAHTASLFPDTPALRETKRLVMPNPAPVLGPRLTWTPPALRAARAILVLVIGAGKRPALKRALDGAYAPLRVPIQSVLVDHPDAVVIADREAAGI